jgi:hypothetical protein
MDLSAPLAFDDNDAADLAVVLGCTADQVKDKLVAHAQAALEEYTDMYLGRRAPTQGKEILEQRLCRLMQRALTDGLPTDDQVGRLFNTNQSAARTLIRNTISKHRFQLSGAVAASAKTALQKAVKDGDRFVLTIRSNYLAEWMNQDLARSNQGSPPLILERSRVSRYSTAKSSYQILCELYQAQPIAGA